MLKLVTVAFALSLRSARAWPAARPPARTRFTRHAPVRFLNRILVERSETALLLLAVPPPPLGTLGRSPSSPPSFRNDTTTTTTTAAGPAAGDGARGAPPAVEGSGTPLPLRLVATIAADDARAVHVRTVLRAADGDRVRAGVLDGGAHDDAVVSWCGASGALRLVLPGQ